jgi:hypothetical protein
LVYSGTFFIMIALFIPLFYIVTFAREVAKNELLADYAVRLSSFYPDCIFDSLALDVNSSQSSTLPPFSLELDQDSSQIASESSTLHYHLLSSSPSSPLLCKPRPPPPRYGSER